MATTPLAIITESAQQQIVREISSVLQRELGHSLPRHLKPVISALDEFRILLQQRQSFPPLEEKRYDTVGLSDASLLSVSPKQVDSLPQARAMRTAPPADQSDEEEGKQHNE